MLLDDTDKEWDSFAKRIKAPVQIFIEELNGKYHPQTWLFYGASADNKSDAFLTWKERPALRPVPVMGYPEPSSPTYRYDAASTFELISAGTPGDGTVPVKAIRTQSPRIRGVLTTDVDHEGAYAVDPVDRSRSVYSDLSDALLFTVRSVVKIAQQVPAP